MDSETEGKLQKRLRVRRKLRRLHPLQTYKGGTCGQIGYQEHRKCDSAYKNSKLWESNPKTCCFYILLGLDSQNFLQHENRKALATNLQYNGENCYPLISAQQKVQCVYLHYPAVVCVRVFVQCQQIFRSVIFYVF